jgi:XisI protein
MDKLKSKVKKYEGFVLNILGEYAKIRYSNLDARNMLIADTNNHHYQVVTMGWDGKTHVHDCPIHIDIIDGKIWIQQNMTEIDLDDELMQLGVPKTDIVLGFLSPKMREYTDYALA